MFNYHINDIIDSKCFVYSSPELDVQQEKFVEMCNVLIITDKDVYDSACMLKLNVSDLKELPVNHNTMYSVFRSLYYIPLI